MTVSESLRRVFCLRLLILEDGGQTPKIRDDEETSLVSRSASQHRHGAEQVARGIGGRVKEVQGGDKDDLSGGGGWTTYI